MLRVLIWLGQFLFVGHAAYSSIISLWGLRTPIGAVAGEPRRRMRVVVAAHNEATVIAGVASDLASQQYPSNLVRACVIADRCTDDTAEIARTFVEVAERSIGEGAKGAAISWYLDQEPLDDDEALLVLDADNRIGPNYLHGVAAALTGECEVVQTYLDIANPDGSVLSTANALTYWASNRMVQLSRSNIGWSCDLGGTGMAMSSRSLAQAGGFGDDLTDDLSLNIRLNLVGHRAKWLHDIPVYDEKPTDTRSTVAQRARWVRGKRDLQRRYGWSLVRSGISRRQPALLDLAFRLYNPGRSFVAFIVAILALVAAAFPEAGLWPWWLLASIAAIAALLPMLFLVIDRVPARYIARYPYVALIALLWIPIRIGSRIVSSWRRTPHRG